MDTLWKKYQNIDSYYGIRVLTESLFNSWDKEAAANACRLFIERHYKRGEKERALDIPFIETYNQSGKHLHTVSLYLLGNALKDTFSSRIEEGVKNALKCECNWYKKDEFLYSWFLTCLYHDVASCIETKMLFNASESQKRLDFYLKKWNVSYNLYEHRPIKERAELNCYSEKLIENYFYYRATNGEIDHGIIGGYLLFDRLKKNFLTKTTNKELKKDGYYNIDNGDGIKWHVEHPDHFAYVADAIICHNLWTRNEGDRSNEYEQYGLDPLIIKNESDKVNIKRVPLQFMLRLLDSLEPTKRFENVEPRKVLENVFMSSNKKEITIGYNPWLKNQKGFRKWSKTIEGLDDWMDVEVSDDKVPYKDRRLPCYRIVFLRDSDE